MCCPIFTACHHHLQHHHRHRDYRGGLSELPRIRTARQDSQLGRIAQPGRTQVHGSGPLAGHLARAVPDNSRLWAQHVRRCGAGPAGSAAAGRRRPLRGDNQTKRSSGPTLPARFQAVGKRKRDLLARLINPFHQ